MLTSRMHLYEHSLVHAPFETLPAYPYTIHPCPAVNNYILASLLLLISAHPMITAPPMDEDKDSPRAV